MAQTQDRKRAYEVGWFANFVLIPAGAGSIGAVLYVLMRILGPDAPG